MIIRVPDDRALLELQAFLSRHDCITFARPEIGAVEAACPHLTPEGERRRIDELVAEWQRTRKVA